MPNVSITSYHDADLQEVLAKGERVLWSGSPSYGQRFLEASGHERIIHISLLVGALVMWASLWVLGLNPDIRLKQPILVFSIMTFVFGLISIAVACMRQDVMRSLVYFVTDKRAIVFKRGRNWFFSTRLYVVSCDHMAGFPYEVIPGKPFASLQVGMLLSQDQLQPFGLGLAHPGLSILRNRTLAPVMFENMNNAQELQAMIYACLSTKDDNEH